jgi:hypothetical protein
LPYINLIIVRNISKDIDFSLKSNYSY